ncbi:hypothetical protein DM02DRAFT_599949 [Periconia macrospinosa]|uniref:Uncharacterized protein n=1 Tax=Periconia macrospinosa TaxID=97972 RepID=A0A2V1DD96_9PLEO|nr:hypothetical protein DM02DRAFT_599949 [Periconia macrospinosa]
MSSDTDYKVAALAAGFTIGFGFLTVWEAIKQTRRNHNPLRSSYIYMIWGQIAANLGIGIIGWLILNGVLHPTVPVFFFILLCWVFEIQLLMQIIINRIALIAEHRRTIWKIKWGTVAIITATNVAVFVIWIPAHLDPPPSKVFVQINAIWDKISKIIILVVDAGLNWYFLRTVQNRLVNQHGLTKYQPLVGFNAKLMVVSILMDVMLIGLMFLPNQLVYIQFHPVTYIVKLNIEMSMASLVVRLAKGTPENDMHEEHQYSSGPRSRTRNTGDARRYGHEPSGHFASFQLNSVSRGQRKLSEESQVGITCTTDVVVERSDKVVGETDTKSGCSSLAETVGMDRFGDELPLRKDIPRVREVGGV